MKITVNGLTIESDDPANVVAGVIASFGLDSDFEVIRAWALDHLNTWRGQQRAALGLTLAAFQELVYTGKVLECQRWLSELANPKGRCGEWANGEQPAFGLAQEAAARGLTNEQMAGLVLGQWAAWSASSDAIEAEYITVRAAVGLAESAEEIAAALAGL